MKVSYARVLSLAAVLCSALFVFHTEMFLNWKTDVLHWLQRTVPANKLDGNRRLQGMTETLTRYGGELGNFDPEMCPPGSLTLNVTHMTPLHFDCPTLFIVGTPKGGTTTLIELVSMHPNFEGADLHKKGVGKGEIFYFTRCPIDHKAPKTWDQYKEHFPTGVVTGESTALYLAGCEVPKRLFQACGVKAKVVMLFRNPVHRIISHFVMDRMLQPKKKISVDDYVNIQLKNYNLAAKQLQFYKSVTRDWKKPSCIPQLDVINVVYFGLYYQHLMNWLCNFPANNIMVINSEEFYRHTPRVVTQVLHFIGLNSLPEETNTVINTTVYNKGRYDKFDTRMSDKLLKQLHNLYKPFNKALFELLHWEDVDWS